MWVLIIPMAQQHDAFKKGDYAIVNLMYTPVEQGDDVCRVAIWKENEFQG